MSSNHFELICLSHPPTGGRSTGKIYVGMTGRINLTLYGPNTPGASGRINSQKDAQSVLKHIASKQRSGYTKTTPDDLPQAMIPNIIRHIRAQQPALARMEVMRNGEVLTFSDPNAPSPSADRPRRRQSDIRIWL